MWMESQTTKDLYKQMLLQEIRSLAADIKVTVNRIKWQGQ